MTTDDVSGAETTVTGEGSADRSSESKRGPRAAAPTVNQRVDAAWARGADIWDGGVDRVRRSPVGRWWAETTAPGLVDWSLLIAITALAFVTFLYGDVRATFEHSFNFLDALLAGRPQDFYQIAIENSTFGHPAVYDVPIYLIFGLWNLPSYLAYRLFDYDYLNSLPAQLWLKAMMLAFTLVAARLVYQIAKEIGLEAKRARWSAFFFLSSMTLFVPVFVIVQYDIVSVTLMLAGILAYMRGNTKGFLLWFLAANTLKLFSVFVFVPLVLLREKRLPRAAAQIVAGMLGLLACRLLYHNNLAYEISTGGFTDGMLSRLRTAGFTWQSPYSVPLFVVFMVCLVIFSYAKRVSSTRELQAFAIYLPLAAFLVFCAIVPLNPYWAALVSPFIVLVIFLNPRHFTLNSVMEVGFGSALFLIYSMVGYSMYNAGIFSELLFGRLVPPASPQRFQTPQEILAALGIPELVPFLIGFMIACTIGLLVLNYPRAAIVTGVPNLERIPRTVVWVRLAAPVCFMLLMFGFYLIPAKPMVFTSTTATPTRGQVDVLSPGAVVEQDLTLESTAAIEEIQLGFDGSAITWIDSATVNLTVSDATDAVVFEGSAAANALGVGLTAFATPGLTLTGGEEYMIRLSGMDSEGEPVFVQFNPDRDDFLTTENGEVVAGDLVLNLVGIAVD